MEEPRSELVKALVRAGLRGGGLAGPTRQGMGAGRPEGEEERPAYGSSGRRSRAPIYETGKEPGPKPRPSSDREVSRNVNTIRGEADGVNYGPHMGTAMAAAMSNGMNWRVIRAMPLLMIASGGRA